MGCAVGIAAEYALQYHSKFGIVVQCCTTLEGKKPYNIRGHSSHSCCVRDYADAISKKSTGNGIS